MFPQEKLSEIFIQMSKNLKWKIVLICSRGKVSVSLKIFFWWLQNHRGLVVSFFLDFSKSVPAQKIPLSTRFFCLIMLHLLVNRKNHHSEVYHVTKKIIRWVFLFKYQFSESDGLESERSGEIEGSFDSKWMVLGGIRGIDWPL